MSIHGIVYTSVSVLSAILTKKKRWKKMSPYRVDCAVVWYSVWLLYFDNDKTFCCLALTSPLKSWCLLTRERYVSVIWKLSVKH